MHRELLSLSMHPGCYPSEGALWYVKRGKEIPDHLLPGRALMKMSPEYREKFIKTDFSNVAPWWIKVLCG